MNYEAVNELLVSAGLFDPEEYGVSVAVTFGYRAREIAPKSRRSIEDLGDLGLRFCPVLGEVFLPGFGARTVELGFSGGAFEPGF